jgi:hypothetical protein
MTEGERPERRMSGDGVRLCVQTYHPIDPHNCDGPIHCTACGCGTPCVTAIYARVSETTFTAEERAQVVPARLRKGE